MQTLNHFQIENRRLPRTLRFWLLRPTSPYPAGFTVAMGSWVGISGSTVLWNVTENCLRIGRRGGHGGLPEPRLAWLRCNGGEGSGREC